MSNDKGGHLQPAARLINNNDHCIGAYARRENGRAQSKPEGGKPFRGAVSFSAIGAIHQTYCRNDRLRARVIQKFLDLAGGKGVEQFNDTNSKAIVVATLDRAEQFAKAEVIS